MDITFLRGIITAMAMFVGLFLFDKKSLKIRIKDIWCFVGTGALSVCFFNYCYFKTITLTSLSVAAVLLYLAPAFVMLMSAPLFREKITGVKLIAVIMALFGCAMVSGIMGGNATLSGMGILYGIGSGFGYALYSIFGRYALNKGYNSLTITFYTFLFCSISSILYINPAKVVGTVLYTEGLLVWTVGMMLFVTLFPYLAYTKGLQKVENGTASVVASIEPVVATVLGILIYKEEMDFVILLGMICVLGSVVLINLAEKIVQK